MKTNLLLTALAIAVLALALGGWLVRGAQKARNFGWCLGRSRLCPSEA